MSDLSDAPQMPEWFDTAKHHSADGGIFETATGVLLAEDGGPKSLAVRMMRAEARTEREALDERITFPKKRRDTVAILADHQAALADAEAQKE